MLDLLITNNLGPQANKTATSADLLRESKKEAKMKQRKLAKPSHPKSHQDPKRKKKPTDATSSTKR